MWNTLTRTVAPSGDVLTLDEVKAHLRVEVSDEDDLITACRDAAVGAIEGPKGIGVALLPQTWRATLPGFPRDGRLELPLGPVTAVSAIAYVGQDGQTQTLDPSAYVVNLGCEPALVEPVFGTCFPPTRPQSNAVQVTFTCGYANAAAVPAPIKAALRLMIGDLYANRESRVIDVSRVTMIENPTAERLLAPYRAWL